MHYTTVELVTLIAAAAAAIVSMINAVANGWGRAAVKQQLESVRTDTLHQGEIANTKLDVIHTLTNSNMTELKRQLSVALERIEKLESLLDTRRGNT